MFAILGEVGCCEYFYRWLPESFVEAWAEWDRADQMALLLARVGFDFDEVVAPARLVDQGDRLEWRTPEAAGNAVCRLCDLVPEAGPALCDSYRAAYPLELVAEKLFAFLSSTGAADPATEGCAHVSAETEGGAG